MSVEESRLPTTATQRQNQLIMRLVRELVVLLLGTVIPGAAGSDSIHSDCSRSRRYPLPARRSACC